MSAFLSNAGCRRRKRGLKLRVRLFEIKGIKLSRSILFGIIISKGAASTQILLCTSYSRTLEFLEALMAWALRKICDWEGVPHRLS